MATIEDSVLKANQPRGHQCPISGTSIAREISRKKISLEALIFPASVSNCILCRKSRIQNQSLENNTDACVNSSASSLILQIHSGGTSVVRTLCPFGVFSHSVRSDLHHILATIWTPITHNKYSVFILSQYAISYIHSKYSKSYFGVYNLKINFGSNFKWSYNLKIN